MIKHNKKSIIILLLGMALCAELCFSASSYASTFHIWESSDVTDPTAVESISGTSFAATAAFVDWAQTQTVSSGAGLSVGASYPSSTPVQSASLWLGNFQNTSQTNVNVTAGSYIAVSYAGVGADFGVTINSTYVSDYHANYHETDGVDHTGYVVVYFKLKAFTINYGTNINIPDVKLADLTSGTLGVGDNGMDFSVITHTNLMNEGTDPTGSGMFVSSGLLDSTPEIPPNAIPALYTGLGTLLLYGRRKMQCKSSKNKKAAKKS